MPGPTPVMMQSLEPDMCEELPCAKKLGDLMSVEVGEQEQHAVRRTGASVHLAPFEQRMIAAMACMHCQLRCQLACRDGRSRQADRPPRRA